MRMKAVKEIEALSESPNKNFKCLKIFKKERKDDKDEDASKSLMEDQVSTTLTEKYMETA